MPKALEETVVPKAQEDTTVPKALEDTVGPKALENTKITKALKDILMSKVLEDTTVAKALEDTVVPKAQEDTSLKTTNLTAPYFCASAPHPSGPSSVAPPPLIAPANLKAMDLGTPYFGPLEHCATSPKKPSTAPTTLRLPPLAS